MPAHAGIQAEVGRKSDNLDSRFRGNDERRRIRLPVDAIGIFRYLSHGCLILAFALLLPGRSRAADKFTTIYSARVMAQALPWIAEDAGLFKKFNLDHNLVFIASSSIVTAALLGGDPDMTMTGGVGNVIAFVRGSTEIAYVGSAKNLMTQNIIAGGNLKRPEDLKGK
ncbi:MAG TPA: hypothetical protein VE170_09660, partial [Candidatus Limnocylindria bacterium]|nr:hypothetical protein [Candidatus Limnocylindria bacterium]